MDISKVKYNLGKQVRLSLPRHGINGEYILTGCVIRRNRNGSFFYQAELADKSNHAVMIASLGDISEIKGGIT